MSAIEFTDVAYSYLYHGQSFRALEHINLCIQTGEFVCLLGRSGCGKTTLLRLLAGLQFPESGSVCIAGQPVSGPDTDRAMVFQNYTLFPWMTARKNVQFGIRQSRKELSRSQSKQLALSYLEQVGMADAADKYPYQLSGGMQQRVAIARALAMDTEILLMDEPFGALDARNRLELQQLMIHLRSTMSKTVVFVTHDISEAILLADRIIYMEPGRIAGEVTVELPFPRDLHCSAAEQLRQTLFSMYYEGEREVP